MEDAMRGSLAKGESQPSRMCCEGHSEGHAEGAMRVGHPLASDYYPVLL